MAIHKRWSVFVEILEKVMIDDKDAYRVIMPSGLHALVWANDLMII